VRPYSSKIKQNQSQNPKTSFDVAERVNDPTHNCKSNQAVEED
jgi:hypothetical protein